MPDVTIGDNVVIGAEKIALLFNPPPVLSLKTMQSLA